MKPEHLTLPIREDYSMGWLRTDENACAWEAVHSWCEGCPPFQLVIVGSSSKTFLCTLASQRVQEPVWSGELPTLSSKKAYIIDNADQILASESFLHWYNSVSSVGASVLYTANQFPDKWSHVLPDLVSRLRTLPVVCIDPWKDEDLELLLPRMMRAQGLAISQSTAHFALNHIERSFSSLRRLVSYAHQHAPQKRITKVFLKEFLQTLGS